MTVRVVVADDHTIVCRGVAALLSAVDDLDLVGEAADAGTAVEAAVTLRPDVLLLDIQMPGGGIEAAARVSSAAPDVAVLMLTMFDDDETIRRALAAGALGYVLKGSDPESLVRAIRGVVSGGAVLDPAVARRVLGAASRSAEPPLPDLSPRERHVLELIALGLANPAISERLTISPHTVGNHISSIFRKLGVATRAEAIVRARDAGLGRSARG